MSQSGEVYHALLEHHKISPDKKSDWLSLKGNREIAWLHNASVRSRYVLDRDFGCAHCSTCQSLFPGVKNATKCEESDPPPDTKATCVVCYLKAKETPLNLLEKAVIAYLTDERILVEWLARALACGLSTRCTQFLSALCIVKLYV